MQSAGCLLQGAGLRVQGPGSRVQSAGSQVSFFAQGGQPTPCPVYCRPIRCQPTPYPANCRCILPTDAIYCQMPLYVANRRPILSQLLPYPLPTDALSCQPMPYPANQRSICQPTSYPANRRLNCCQPTPYPANRHLIQPTDALSTSGVGVGRAHCRGGTEEERGAWSYSNCSSGRKHGRGGQKKTRQPRVLPVGRKTKGKQTAEARCVRPEARGPGPAKPGRA